VVVITVTCHSWAPSSGDHLVYMWCHLPTATQAYYISRRALLLRHRWRTNKFSNFKIHRRIHSHCH